MSESDGVVVIDTQHGFDQRFSTHTSPTAITFLEAGTLAALGDGGGAVSLYDFEDERALVTLDSGGAEIIELAADVTGNRLVSVDSEGTVIEWDISPWTTPH